MIEIVRFYLFHSFRIGNVLISQYCKNIQFPQMYGKEKSNLDWSGKQKHQ